MSELAVRASLPEELSVDQVIEQVQKVQQLMSAVMKEGEHYGVIPGTQKPTLLKPGAEKLCLTFRLRPDPVPINAVETPELVSYVVRCTLTHIPTGLEWGSGLGSCNSRENKYRFRWIATTERPDKPESERMKAAGLGGWRKIGDKWVWHLKVENDNAMEMQNTILKMASKRALVAAVLNATAASDCFTQDLEDLPAAKPADATDSTPRVSQDVIDTLEAKRWALADQDPSLWGEEVFLRNLTVRFGAQRLEDLTEPQAVAVMQGMAAWAEANPVDDGGGDVVESNLVEENPEEEVSG